MNMDRRPSLSRLADALLPAADIFIVYLACLCMHAALDEGGFMEARFLVATLGIMLVSRLVFPFAMPADWRTHTLAAQARSLLISWALIVLTIATLAFLTKTGASISRLWFGLSILTACSGQLVLRAVARALVKHARARGYNSRSIVVLGAGSLGASVSRKLQQDPASGLHVIAYFDDNPKLHGTSIGEAPVLGSLDEVHRFVEERRCCGRPIDQVWFALPFRAEERMRELGRRLGDSTVSLRFVPSLLGAQLLDARAQVIADIPLIDMSRIAREEANPASKVVLDYTLATLAVLLLSPLMALIAIGVKLDSSGPVLFKQRRYGARGREVVVWKFRTMHTLEDGEQVRQATREDARVTRLGRFLRKSSLDELPQFLNVLQGRMSIVGPRPHAVAHNEQYRSRIENYMQRHRVKPGITGLAQISGFRGETDTDAKMVGRVERDLAYLSNWSIWLDMEIILLTIREVLSSKSAY